MRRVVFDFGRALRETGQALDRVGMRMGENMALPRAEFWDGRPFCSMGCKIKDCSIKLMRLACACSCISTSVPAMSKQSIPGASCCRSSLLLAGGEATGVLRSSPLASPLASPELTTSDHEGHILPETARTVQSPRRASTTRSSNAPG